MEDQDPWEGDMDHNGDEELRISAEDGMAYSKLEFIAYYGNTEQWDKSEVAHMWF